MSKRALQLATRVVRATDKQLAIRLLANAFLTEPILSNTNITLDEMESFLRPKWDSILRDDLTLLGETQDQHMVCCSMALDFITKPPPTQKEMVTKIPHMMAVMSLMDHVESHYIQMHGFSKETFPANHTVIMRLMGTQPEFRNQGVATRVRAAALEHYKAKGFKFVMGDAFSRFTQRMCLKFGFKTHLRVPYEEWFPKGSIYTKQVADGHEAMHLVVKEL